MSGGAKRLASAALALGVVLAAFGTGRLLSAVVYGDPAAEPRVVRSPSQLTGALLPTTLLRTAGGAVRLRDHVKAPTLVIVADREVCLSCANFPLEMRVLANDLPGLRTLLVLSGPDTAFFRRYARQNGMRGEQLLLDPAGELLRDLGVERGPMVLLADGEGRILWSDTRTGPQFGPHPVSRVLPLLHTLLSGATAAPRDTAGPADNGVRGTSGRSGAPAEFPENGGGQ